jgi:hypothetical protein
MNTLEEKIRNATDSSGARRSFSKESLFNDVVSISFFEPGSLDRFIKLFTVSLNRFKPIVAKIDFRKGVSTDSKVYQDPNIPEEVATKFLMEWIEPQLIDCQCNQDPKPSVIEFAFGDNLVFVATVPILSAHATTDGAISLLLSSDDNSHEIVLSEVEALALCTVENQSETVSGSTAQGSLQVLGKASSFRSAKELGFTLVNLLSDRFHCEQVAFGEIENGRVLVSAISGIANFKSNSPGVVKISQAMEECVDHNDIIVSQRRGDQELENGFSIHQQWSLDTNDSCVCSIPLRTDDAIVSVISFRRASNQPFSQAELTDIQQRINGFGPAISLIKKANTSPVKLLKTSILNGSRKLIGPGEWGRKLLIASLLIGAGYFFLGTTTYTPLCVATLKPARSLQVSAPFNTTLKAVHVQAGDKVVAGDLLFEMDTKNLELELASVDGELGVTKVQMRESLSAGSVTEAALHRSKIVALTSSRQVLQNKIEMSRITAKEAGTVLECELVTRIGQMFQIGQPMLRLANGKEWNVEIEVPDYVSSYIAEEQKGVFATKARPGKEFDLEVTQINESSEIGEAKNVFLAKAELNADAQWLKSGMQGFARVKTVSKPVWWVSLHRVIDYARINFWF